MKKLLLLLCLSLTTLSSMAHDFEVDGIYYNITSQEELTVEVTYYGNNTWSDVKYAGDIIIPETVAYNETTYSVTAIGRYAFIRCRSLTSITVGNNVQSIGYDAFYYCEALTSVTIGNNVHTIGAGAFERCTNLTSITIPSSVETIGEQIFDYCHALQTIIVDKDNPIYDSRYNCNAIIETSTNTLIQGCPGSTIPEGVEAIGSRAFEDFSGLTSIEFPNSLKSIGYCAFGWCSSLTAIHIPGNVNYISDNAFYYCTGIEHITVDEGNAKYFSSHDAIIEDSTLTLVMGCRNTVIDDRIKVIGENAFYNVVFPADSTSGSVSLAFPESLESIEYNAFGWSNLTELNIPKNVTYIYANAFQGCSRTLQKISVEEGNPYYDSRKDCNALIGNHGDSVSILIVGCSNTIMPDNITAIGNYAFYGCSQSEIVIPNGVEQIGEGAFGSCNRLTTVTIPQTVKYIGSWAFEYCWGLTDVYCYIEDIDDLDWAYNIFSESSYREATLHVPAGTLESYQSKEPWSSFGNIVALPPRNVEIGGLYYRLSGKEAAVIFNDSYFDRDGRLTIPESVEHDGKTYNVTEIDEGAFLYCTGLTGVTIGGNVQTIGSEAFMGCIGITTLIIPQGLTNIAAGAFTDCSGLSNIMVRSGNPVYDSRGNCNAVIETATNALVLGCKRTIIPDDVMAISPYAFAGCVGLTSVNIPVGVQYIGTSAFSGCSSLKEVFSYAQSIPVTEDYVFNGVPMPSAILYVPFVSLDVYKATVPWNKFGTIEVIPGDNTAVSSIHEANGEVLDCYDMNGQKQSQLHKGMNIVRMSNGTVKKMLVK